MPKNSIGVAGCEFHLEHAITGCSIGVWTLGKLHLHRLTRAQARKFFERGLALLDDKYKRCDGAGWTRSGNTSRVSPDCPDCKGSGNAGTGRGGKRG